MAAVIAQLNFRHRARMKRLKQVKTYSTAKCMYQLQPFAPRFEPTVHNKYLATRVRNGQDMVESELEKEIVAAVRKNERKYSWPKFTWTRFFVEAILVGMNSHICASILQPLAGCLCSFVPVLWILIELSWPQDIISDHVPM